MLRPVYVVVVVVVVVVVSATCLLSRTTSAVSFLPSASLSSLASSSSLSSLASSSSSSSLSAIARTRGGGDEDRRTPWSIFSAFRTSASAMGELRNAELETEVVATKDDRLVEDGDEEQDDEEHDEEEEDRRRDIMLGNADDEIEFVPAKDDESDDDEGEETAFESVYEYETDVDAEDAEPEEEEEEEDGPATFRPRDDPERFAPSMPPHLQQSSSSSYSEEQPLQYQGPVLAGTTKEDDGTNEDGTGPNDSAAIAVQRADPGLASTKEDDGPLDAATESVAEPAADVAVVEKTTNERGVLERRVADDTTTTTTTTETEEESAFSERVEESSEETPGNVDASVVAKPPSATATVSTTTVAPPTITKPKEEESPYLSSGYWSTIDAVLSFGASSSRESLRLSRRLRRVRKATARATGLRGLLSGKDGGPFRLATTKTKTAEDERPADEGALRRRFAAIDRARERIVHRVDADEAGLLLRGRLLSSDPAPEPRRGGRRRGGGLFRRFGRRRRERSERRSAEEDEEIVVVVSEAEAARAAREEAIERRRLVAEAVEERRRRERVREIDRLIVEGQRTMLELQCEKDSLQRRPNPLYDYASASDDGAGEEKVAKKKKKKKEEEVTKDVSEDSTTTTTTTTTRKFNFPSDSLVEDYLDELKRTRRLVALNHTRLWTDKPTPRRRRRRQDDDDDADVEDDYDYYDYEDVGDDILTPSGNAHRLYDGKSRRRSNAGGSWLLRQTLGQGVTLGERLGQTVEEASYRSVCKAVMGVLAQSISAVHGINVMTHSDVRLYLSEEEQRRGRRRTEAMLRDTLSRKKRAKRDRAATNSDSAADDAPNDDASSFLQRDAVVETLISHCQISAPLLKLFPIDWQRAMLANLVAIVAAVTSDFCDGIRLQLLGHRLSLSFAPVTEEDLATTTGGGGRRARPEEFEAAVRVTARDVSASLTFLDRWHERALGSGMLRAQIGNLVARLVLTLVDGVLDGARIDLWSAQAGGPRVLAGLEHRSSSSSSSSFDGDDDRGAGAEGIR